MNELARALEPLPKTINNSSSRALLSATAYFAGVAGVTVLLLGSAMLVRPSLAYRVGESLGVVETVEASAGSFYAARVAPLFEAHCIGCHGERRQKADLRLDSFAAAKRGGKHGAVIQGGDVKGSELITRITLPPTDDRAMPPEGRPPLSADDVTVIKLWAAAGASAVLPVSAIKDAPPPAKQIRIPEFDAHAAARERAPLAAQVKSLEVQFPGMIAYASRGSADLEINAALRGRAFTDKDLLALGALSPRIVRLDLSGTAITDTSAPVLASMKSLQSLRVTDTQVSDTTIKALTGLQHLQSLAILGTSVSEGSLGPLRSRRVIVYGASDTPMSPAKSAHESP